RKAIWSRLSPPRPLVSTARTVSATARMASVWLAECFPSRTAYPAAVSAATRSRVTPTRARTPIVMSTPSQPQRTRHTSRPAWPHDTHALCDTRSTHRHVILLQEESPPGAAELSVFETRG